MGQLEPQTASGEREQARTAEQYVTFTVGPMHFAVDIGLVQEIIRHQPLTDVPLAPAIVRGLINLRGQVITAIDMRRLLKLTPFSEDARPTNIIVQTTDEVISLLVDSIGDVISVAPQAIEETPATLAPEICRILSGVIKEDKQLTLAINADACLQCEGH